MGYDVHLHRREDWWNEDDGDDILEADLDAVAAMRDDLERRDVLRGRDPRTGKTLTFAGPFWVWTGHPRGLEVPIRLRDGVASVKGPDDDTLAFLVRVAGVLGARVQGDEGEFYPEGS